MILEVLWHGFACVETCLDLGVGDVACYDDGSSEVDACGYWIFGELGAYGVDSAVEVYLYAVGAFAWLGVLLGYELAGVGVHLFNPDAVLVDFGFDVAVCGAAYAHTDGEGGAVAWQAYDAYVVGEVFASELCAEAYLIDFLEELLFEVEVAERAAGLIACGGEIVVVFDGTELGWNRKRRFKISASFYFISYVSRG